MQDIEIFIKSLMVYNFFTSNTAIQSIYKQTKNCNINYIFMGHLILKKIPFQILEIYSFT